MKKILLSLIIVFFVFTSAFATTGTDGKEGAKRDSVGIEEGSVNTGNNQSASSLQVRTFSQLPTIQIEEAPDILNTNIDIPGDSILYYIRRGRALLKNIRENNLFTSVLNAEAAQSLPIGISKNIGGLDYTLAIDSINLTPTTAYLNAYMLFVMPNTGDTLYFYGRNISFSKTGGFSGDVRLELLLDVPIDLGGKKSQLTLKGAGKTYAEFDCSGFKSMGVGAEVEFSKNLLIPVNPDGSVKEGRVKGAFTTVIKDWNDLIASITLDPFQVKELEGVSFHVKEAVFDFSDFQNAPNVVFPSDYKSSLMLPGNPNLWRGFYLKQLNVKLPEQFETKDKRRTEFTVSNLIIDNMGFTGTMVAKQLIKIENGEMSRWAFSLDSLGIAVQANQLREAGFKGLIKVPVLKDDNALNYTAIINAGNDYLFSLKTTKDVEIPLWAAKVNLKPSSYIEIVLKDKKFRPKAYLDGDMNVAAGFSKSSSDKKGVELAQISFEGLQIASSAPYLQVKAFSFGSEAASQKMGKFPVQIKDIGVRIKDSEVGLGFKIVVNLVPSNDSGFGAEGAFTIYGDLDSQKEHLSWKFDRIEVNQLGLNVDNGAFKLKGNIIFFKENITYGNGFQGQLEAEFQPGIKIGATALFGNIEGMRYWYADGMLTIPSGMPIFTGIGIFGFGGGAYYRMSQAGFSYGTENEIGKSLSGIIYKPDEKTYLGIKASLEIGTMPSKQTFNGDVTFEVSFNKGGGVRKISFLGNGYFVTPALPESIEKLKSKTELLTKAKNEGSSAPALETGERASLHASVNISFDFENTVLHGNLKVFVNVAGALKGIGPNNLAGESVMHFAPGEWYIYVGTPDQPVGIELIGMARTESYLMVGTKVLNSPPPPPEVSSILKGVDLDYMKDLNALGSGSGIAFGARLGINTGDLTFLVFYGNFSAGLGFDIMLKNYKGARCEGSGPLGINGWYANGQSYAYVEGELGIKVKLFGEKRDVKILEIGAATVLQAKLPNPFWMRGIVGGYFNALGGLVKGNCKFEMTLGKECKMIQSGSVVSGIGVIASVKPSDSEKDVNVFSAPQVAFNMEIGKEFELRDNDGAIKAFQILLQDFKVTHNGAPILGKVEWNSNNTVVILKPNDILPPKSNLRIQVKVFFQERKNGAWQNVKEGGKDVVEQKDYPFTTGVAPDFIPQENVAFSYPIINQANFYKDEYNKGYLHLKQGQDYLFEMGSEWKLKARFVSQAGVLETNLTYDFDKNKLDFTIPGNMTLDKVYNLDFVYTPLTSTAVDKNVKNVSEKTVSEGDTEVEVTKKEAEGFVENKKDKIVYNQAFKTSKYASLNTKIKEPFLGWAWGVLVGVHELGTNLNLDETFDKFEVNGIEGKNPLIQFEAVLDNNWYKNLVFPLVYEGYPLLGKVTLTRETAALGMPPAKALYIRQDINDRILTEGEIQGGYKSTAGVSRYIYNLPLEMYRDYMDIRNKCANLSVNEQGNVRINKLVNSPFPVIREDNYKVKVKYVLPGINHVASEKTITIQYFLIRQ